MTFKTYEEVEAAFVLPESDPEKLYSADLKKGILGELKPMLEYLRKITIDNAELGAKAYPDLHSVHKIQPGGKPAAAKEAKKGEAKPVVKGAAAKDEDADACPSRLDIRIGEVVDVALHPSSDTLYVEQINVGEEKPRQIISGLVKYITVDEFKGKKVAVICNLKASNFRGVKSEGMVLAASSGDDIKVLDVPEGSRPGDLVNFGQKERKVDDVIDPKKKNNVWNGEQAVPAPLLPDLHVGEDGIARWKDVEMHVGGAPLTSSLKNAKIS